MKKILKSFLFVLCFSFVLASCGESSEQTKTTQPELSTVNKKDISGISFAGNVVAYDGLEHSIYIQGTLPNGVSVTYDGNGKTDAGTYEIIAHFIDTTGEYNVPSDMTATLCITPSNYSFSEALSFESKEFEYDGLAHSIYISSNLPEGLEVEYEGNGKVDVGTYEVIAHFTTDSNHNSVADIKATLTINKAIYDMSNVEFEDQSFTYDGTKKSNYINGTLPEGVSVSYEGNGRIDAGTYEVIAHFTGASNYEAIPDMKATLTINPVPIKQTYDMSGVTFTGNTITYDGLTHSINVTGTLPEGVSVSYEGNGRIDVGTYEVIAHFTGDSNYEAIPDMKATLTINPVPIKQTYDMSGITFTGDAVTYDGLTHSINVTGTLPEGVSVSYEGNGKIDVGTYEVIAHFTGDSNHEEIADMKATLTINKAIYDMSNVEFEDQSFTYDGTKKSNYIKGTLPEGVSVSYEGNGKTNASTYEVIAHFTGDSNHEEIPDAKANLIINKAVYDMSNVEFEDQTYTYSGIDYSIYAYGSPIGVSETYEGNGKIDAGTYTVIVHFKGDSNHEEIPDMQATLTINKARYSVSDITFNNQKFTYDGTEKSIYINGYLPKGVSVSYEGNGKIDANTYEVIAHFTGDSNHEEIADMKATLTIAKATYRMSDIRFSNEYLNYDGLEHSIYITGTLPEGVSVAYEGNGKTNAGEHIVVANFIISNPNYNEIASMQAKLTIRKVYYSQSIDFQNEAQTYDGNKHYIYVTGDIPYGLKVTYEGNGVTDVGSYDVTAHFTEDENHYPIGDLTATLYVLKARYNMNGISFNGGSSYEYDGTPKSIYITGTLPDGVSVSYEGNEQTNVGTYEVITHFTGNKNYEDISDKKASFTITQGVCDLSGISFEDISYEYDGTPKSIYITGELPLGVSVTYEGNGQSELGSYTITAHFDGHGNYKDIPDKTAILTISKKKYDMSNVKFDDTTICYDGLEHSIYITGTLPAGVTVTYEGNKKVELGKYEVIAHFAGDSDYESIPDMKATLTISKEIYDMSNVKFENTTIYYDGLVHNIYITGALPAGVTVAYEGNGKIENGEYTVIAHFTGDSDHEAIPDLSAIMTICYDPDNASIIESGSIVFTDNVGYVKVSNETTDFDFKSVIKVYPGATWNVTWINGDYGYITEKYVNTLKVGDNKLYIFVKSSSNNTVKYEVIIRRKPIYDIKLSDNNTIVETLKIEEDDVINTIDTAKAGYTFNHFEVSNKIITLPYTVTKSETINLVYTANTNTLYKVEHYKEKLNGTYELIDTLSYYGTSDSTVNSVPLKSMTGFKEKNFESQVINPDGSSVFKVYYDRILYKVSATITGGGVVNGLGEYKYGSTIKLKGVPYLGYEFVSWMKNNVSVSSEIEYEVEVNSDVSIQISFVVKAEMKNYEFVSTIDTCKINKVIDKTLTSYSVPDYVTEIKAGAFGGLTNITSISLPFIGLVKGDEEIFAAIFGAYHVTYVKDYLPKTLTSVTINDGNGCIKEYAFAYCTTIESITILNNVTGIGLKVFYDCESLSLVSVPKTYTSIGDWAFFKCFKLSSFDILDGIEVIGEGTFQECAFEEVVLPNSVKAISKYAFWNCSKLKKITISNSDVTLGASVFYQCSNLTIIYNGTKEAWNNAVKDSKWDNEFNKYTIKCLDGDIVKS